MNNEDFDTVLGKFEDKVKTFGTSRGTAVPEVAKNVRDIKTWVNEQRADARSERISENISGVGNVLQTSIESLEDLTSGNPANVMKGCLSIAGSVAAMVAGPYGAAAGAVCGILGSILTLTSSREPDMATVFTNIVRTQLQEFNQTLKTERFRGLEHRVKIMSANLNRLKSAAPDEKTAEKRLIPDMTLLETDFPQFIAEVSENFTKGSSLDSENLDKDLDGCVKSMVMYCNAQTLFIVLLTNVLAKFKVTGRETESITVLIDAQKDDGKKKLGFLSDLEALACPFDPRDGTAMMALTLRGDKSGSYNTVKAFRESLGLSPMLGLNDLKSVSIIACIPDMQESTSHKYPQPQTQGKHHYFQFINETDLPVKVVCGTAGWPVNQLSFTKDVPPRSSYEHAATTWLNWTFSTGGYFIIYLDGKKKSDEEMFESDHIKVYEFALANPMFGAIKSNFMDKSAKVVNIRGEDCWNAINKSFECLSVPGPSFFVHKNEKNEVKKYVVSTGITSFYDFPGVKTPPGKNGCRTWRYSVQVFK